MSTPTNSTTILITTGPESSGKTTLARQLSDYWKTPLISEVARDYLKDKDTYQQQDLLEIAKQQHQQELDHLSASPIKLVCDTDLLVIMVWSEIKYGHCDRWITTTFENSIKQQTSSRFYFLCDCNIPWQADPLRENPHNRDELFALYLQKLKKYGLSHSIVKGNPQERLQHALNSKVSE
jgi:nicotinamide riboside kinase